MRRKNNLVIILVISLILFGIGFLLNKRYHILKGHRLLARSDTTQPKRDLYFCPMHPGYTSDKPGDCAICGMKLVKKRDDLEDSPDKSKDKNKVLYYRNPMNPEVTSPVPMKDQMGMDYIPVYETESIDKEEAGVYIDPERQQMIGVKKEKVQERALTYQILTVGIVAYDPELFVAQEEYLQAKNNLELTKSSVLPTISAQSQSLLDAAKKKLLLLGMNEQGIEELAKQDKAQENLYLPLGKDTVWIYMTIYEYEMSLIKDGLPVQIETVAFPGVIFKGKISGITPVLDPITRSLKVRVETQDPEHKLKPQMFVNAKVNIDLGEKLAVPEEAVLDTGERKVVFIVLDDGNFISREVTLGYKAGGYFEVLAGLSGGDLVVTSGNFFIDSETRMKAAISGASHQHGQ